MKFDPLYGHNDGVNCLTYWNTIAASGSDDHTVRLWDLRTMGCINILDGFFNKRIVSICHNPRMMQQLFVACGNQGLEFDLRNLATVVSSYEPVGSVYETDVLRKMTVRPLPLIVCVLILRVILLERAIVMGNVC